jgi:tetratricopeptide (TPR) repeat protein
MQLMNSDRHQSACRRVRSYFHFPRITIVAFLLAVRLLPADEAQPPPSLLVAHFQDDTAGRIGTGVAEAMRDLLQLSLSSHEQIRLVEREQLNRILDEYKLSLASTATREQGLQLGRLIGAEHLLNASLMPEGEELLAVLHLVDVKTATVQHSLKTSGKVSELPEMTSRIADQIATALELPAAQAALPRLERATLAAAHYLRGLNSFHAGNYDHAIMQLAISDELNLGNPSLHYWSGRAYQALNELEHAIIEYDRYLMLAPQPPANGDVRQRLRDCWAAMEVE